MGLLNEFSIQLYSVREQMESDLPKTLETLAKIGYTGVEFAGYFGIPATEMKKMLDDNGLKSIGSHIGTGELDKKLDELIEYNNIIGSQFIICPHESFDGMDSVMRFAEKCNNFGAKMAPAGMKFGYHNHAHEFEKYDGEYIMDILLANTDKSLVIAEFDLYWLAHAGVDIKPYLDKHGSRAELLHFKQIENMETKRCVNLKNGVIDYAQIVHQGIANNCKQFILEQEEFDGPVYDALKENFDYIMGL